MQELNQTNEVTHFANSISVAVQDFQKAQSRQSTCSSNYGHSPKVNDGNNSVENALRDIIRIYNQI